jgi:hypothetical protein
MSKRVAFVVLVVLAIVFGGLAWYREADFLAEAWSQLFWLTLATLTTTFVLDAILQRAAEASRRSRDAFAFRSFAAHMLEALSGIVLLSKQGDQILEAALSGDEAFEAAARGMAGLIEQSSGFDPGAYHRNSQNVASGLRDLSVSYIRLFSASRKDMLDLYKGLNSLANEWGYRDEFSEGWRTYTDSPATIAADRAVREAALQRQIASARTLTISTARQLAQLAARVARGKGFYD